MEKKLKKKKRSDNLFRRRLRRFFMHKPAIVGLVILTAMVILAVFAPLFTSHDPYFQDYSSLKQPPGNGYILGTDALGRAVWARLVYATRVSMSVGLVAVIIYAFIGSTLGALAGYYGGWVDLIIMRLTDTVMTFPVLIIIITIVALVGANIVNIMLVIGFLSWPGICRLVRGQILSLREMEFITATRALGASGRYIIIQHLLPNVVSQITVAATFGIAIAIMTEASLSFLGLGVPAPIPSWGQMLTDAQKLSVLATMPWLWVPPGAMISLTVLSVNFVGDGLRDALDPHMDQV